MQGDRRDDSDAGARSSTGRRPTSRSGRPRCATGGGCCRSPPTWSARSSTPSCPGDPNDPLRSEHAFYRVDGGAGPGLRAARDRRSTSRRTRTTSRRRNDDAVQIIRGLEPAVGELRVLRAARLPPLRRRRRSAPDDGVRRRPAAAPAHRGLLQPPGERRQPLHHQPARCRRPDPPAQRDRQRRRQLGRVLRAPCATRTSTASPRSACSAGRRTPTTSTGGCWSG